MDLLELSKFHVILLPAHVRVETEKLFEDRKNLLKYFKQLVKDLKEQRLIETDPKSSTLKKEFKNLKHYMRGIRVRVERTDRHIVALACQEKAEIHTKDPGIERALKIIQTRNSARPWRISARKVKINRPIDQPISLLFNRTS